MADSCCAQGFPGSNLDAFETNLRAARVRGEQHGVWRLGATANNRCMRILGYVCVGLYILALIGTSRLFGMWALILAAGGGVAAYYVDENPLTARRETGLGTARWRPRSRWSV